MSELKYNVGDEVLIKGKVTEVFHYIVTPYPYKVKFDYGNIAKAWCDSVTETSIAGIVDEFVKVDSDQNLYKQGIQDLWDTLNCIMDMPWQEVDKLFGISFVTDLLCTCIEPMEIIDKVNAWKEEQNSIKQGDIVDLDYIDEYVTRSIRGVYFSSSYDYYWILVEGEPEPQQLLQDEWTIRKVDGEHIDIFKERS